MNELGSAAWKQRDLDGAEKYYHQSVAEQNAHAPDSMGLVQALNGLGNVAEKRGQLVQAEDCYQRALTIGQKLDSRSAEVADSLHGIGNVSLDRGELTKAEQYFMQALALRRERAPDSMEVGVSLDFLSAVARFQGNLAKARQLSEQALAIEHKVAPQSLEVANTLSSLGTIAYLSNDSAKAEDYYNRALAIRKILAPESLDMVNSLYRLGTLTRDRDDLPAAADFYKRALELAERLNPGSLLVAAILDGLCYVEAQRDDLALAEQYEWRALAIQEKLAPGTQSVAISLIQLGEIARVRGDLSKAEDYGRQALEIRQKLNMSGGEISESLNQLGLIAQARGDLDLAEQYHRRALAIREKLESSSDALARTLVHLGEISQARGDLAGAEKSYRRALALQEKLEPESGNVSLTFNSLGEISRLSRDFAKAEEYQRRALTIQQKILPGSFYVAQTVGYLGALSADRGDLKQAEDWYRQGLAIWQKSFPGSTYHVGNLAALAQTLSDQGQLDAAAPLFEQSITMLEQQVAHLGGSDEVRSDYRASHAGYYKSYIDLLVRQGHAEAAFLVLERSRARTLLETLAEAHTDIRRGVDPALLEQERRQRENIGIKSQQRNHLLQGRHTDEQAASLAKQIDDLLVQYRETEGRIRAASPAYAALTHPQPLTARQIQQQLQDANTLLLEYSLGESHSYVWAVTQNSLEVFELPPQAKIESLARAAYNWQAANGHESRNQDRERQSEHALKELSLMILGPLAVQLQNKRLVIVSDGALEYIPFASLLEPEAAHGKEPLIANHEIVNLPSASVLAVLRQQFEGRPRASKSVVVIADPVFDEMDDRLRVASGHVAVVHGGQTIASGLQRSANDVGISGGVFPRLPFSRREAKGIISVASQGSATEILDFDASRANATGSLLREYRIVHFSTHGLLNSEHPELSGLVFSLVDRQGRPQDGFLRLLDVYNLELNADLVVLSACQTALGRQVSNEGMVGLTRGFMYAGSPRVLSSLWTVDDEATAQLMKRFYEGMLKRHESAAQALREAQLWMRVQKEWQAPYYWAGFVLQGEWK